MADLPPDPDKASEDQTENQPEDQHGQSAAESSADEASEQEPECSGERAADMRAEELQSGASPPPASPLLAANRDPEPPAQRTAEDPPEKPAEQLKHTTASKQSPADLDWSEDEEEEPSQTPPSKLSTLTTEPDPLQEKSEDQHAEDLSLDAKSDAEKKQRLAQKEEDLKDMSVEMECEEDNDDDEEDEEEEKEVATEKDVEEEREEETPEEGGEHEEGDEKKEGGGEDKCHDADDAVKQKKGHIECRDCGKTFTRRETYNLHRHVHMHQEEQASLTCKDCGLTFQHRSSLIKHRSEHQQNGVPPPPPALTSRRRARRREFKEEMSIECDQCGERFGSVIRYRLHACQQSPEKLYRCPLCRKEFQYRVSINAHMQSHSLDSPYRCLECNKGFQCAVTLHIHERSHAALKPYECPDCGMVFRHRSFMEDHRRKHTEERPHQCKMCHKSFKYSSLLQQHQYLHTGQKPYRCSECGKRFAFAQNMRAHYRQHKKTPDFTSTVAHTANRNVSQVAGLGTSGKENTNHEVEKQRNCPLCPRLFYKAADLREHMLIHEVEYENMSNGKKNEPAYACPYCPLKFFEESILQSHVSIHQVHQGPAPLKREVLSVAREGSIDNMSGGGGEGGDQTEKKPLKCKECGKCFRYRSVLELHMRIHNKGYQCHICKKSFRFSSYLQQHLIIHSGKKPYKCPDCGKDFAFLQNMKTHQRLHQQKPFRCNQCRKGYSDESQLQRHMLSHTGEKPHKCHLCDKSFGLAYLLRDHLNTHTGERPHRCQECHKSFPWLSSLLVHQKIHARKRQALNQSYSSLVASRTRGVAGRARRNARWISSWPRMGEDIGRTMPMTQDSFPDDVLQGSMLPNMIGQPSVSDQQSLLPWQTEGQARPGQQQQQWQIHIKPQQQPKWSSDGQQNDMKHHFMSGVHLKPILPKLAQPQNPTWSDPAHDNNGQEQTKQQQLAVWEGSSTSAPKSPSNSGESSADPRARSPTSKTPNSPDATQNTKAELQSQSPKDKTANTDSDKATKSGEDQGPPTDEAGSKPWGFRPPLEMPNPLNLQEKQQMQLVLHPPPTPQMQLLQQPLQQLQQEQLQQFLQQQQLYQSQQQQNHISSAWDGAPQANQLGTISIQFGGPRFAAPGPGGAVWNFQTTPVVSQTLINGPIQQGPVVSGPPILVNKNPPFISTPLALPSPLALPGPLSLPGPAPGIFFTPQGLPSPHLTQRTEPLKPGSQVLFGPDRRFCCMVCGCTLPGELELQMHYMQHAQGEI